MVFVAKLACKSDDGSMYEEDCSYMDYESTSFQDLMSFAHGQADDGEVVTVTITNPATVEESTWQK